MDRVRLCILVAVMIVGSVLVGCIEQEAPPATTPTSTPYTSTEKQEPKYSVGDILKAEGQGKDYAYLILDYDANSDSYQTTIARAIGYKWVNTGQYPNKWNDRNYYEETLGLVKINHVDVIEPLTIHDDKSAIDLIDTMLNDKDFLKYTNSNNPDITTQVVNERDKGGVKALEVSYSTCYIEDNWLEHAEYILDAYLICVAAGWDIDELTVIVETLNYRPFGTWHCEKEWTDDYKNGRLTQLELLYKVEDTWTRLSR